MEQIKALTVEIVKRKTMLQAIHQKDPEAGISSFEASLAQSMAFCLCY
jgi:hypothetical protein